MGYDNLIMIKKSIWERWLVILVFYWLGGTGFGQESARPWTWWFWPGAAVTEDGIRSQLESFKKSGFGGVSINSIYATKDLNHPTVPFMSEKWIGMIRFTLKTADSLGIQVDLSPVSGWPFGGPTVTPADAAKKILGTMAGRVSGGVSIERKIYSADTAMLLSLTAIQVNEETVAIVRYVGNLSEKPSDRQRITPIQLITQTDSTGILRTRLPAGQWQLYALYLKPTGQKVKRSGPGGEGLVLDPFSKPSVEHYLDSFSPALKSFSGLKLRAVFNDSYVVYGADGTPDILNEFRTRRGYSLEDYPDIFLGPADNPDRVRIIADYRQTFAELLYEKFLATWTGHSHGLGLKTREQAHGAPANILDLYAEADIPETESFGSSAFKIPGVITDPDFNPTTFGRPNPLILKFASSAANLSGKKLVSAETTTWLANHFKVSLSQIKPQLDELFTSGINHVMLASSASSPADVPWPGWIFYASTDFGHNTSFYEFLPAFSDYIKTCQEILQDASADNDLMLYFPFSEVISTVGKDMGNLVTLDVHHPEKWLYPSDFGKLARELLDRGISFDFISDNQLRALPVQSKKTILIPDCRIIPVETAAALEKLVSGSSTVLFHNRQPDDVPGFYQVTERRKMLAEINGKMLQEKDSKKPQNQISVGADIYAALADAGINGEPFGREGLRYIRKVKGDETIYFVTNLAGDFHEGWIKPGTPGRNVMRFDPLTHKSHLLERDSDGRIFLQLDPGESCFIRINDFIKNQASPDSGVANYSNHPANKPRAIANQDYLISSASASSSAFATSAFATSAFALPGPWKITFSGGGPVVPQPAKGINLGSWTTLADTLCQWYSGVGIYETDFTLPKEFRQPKGKGKGTERPGQEGYRLNLGDVREAAEVWINGHYLGRAWSVPFRLDIAPEFLKSGNNHLKVAVTNHAVNRVIWQDRNKVPWKNYFFVDITYNDFSAKLWSPVASGLLGPVTLEGRGQRAEGRN